MSVVNFPDPELRRRKKLLEEIEKLKESHRMLNLHIRDVRQQERNLVRLGTEYELMAKEPDPEIVSFMLYLI